MVNFRIFNDYFITSDGFVDSKTRIHNNYLVTTNGDYIHVLIAKAFPEICGEWFEGCNVHHINFVKLDNRAENLIVCTKQQHQAFHKQQKSENGKLSFLGKHHTDDAKEKMRIAHTGKKLEDYHKKKISDALKVKVAQMDNNGNIIKIWDSITDIVASIGATHVSECCRGKRKTDKGYKWKYYVGENI